MINSLFLWVSRHGRRCGTRGVEEIDYVLATEDGQVVITEDEKYMIDMEATE